MNPNNGWALNTTNPGPLIVARNSIYHSATYPSRVILPVVSLADLPEHRVETWTEEAETKLARSGRDFMCLFYIKFFYNLDFFFKITLITSYFYEFDSIGMRITSF